MKLLYVNTWGFKYKHCVHFELCLLFLKTDGLVVLAVERSLKIHIFNFTWFTLGKHLLT